MRRLALIAALIVEAALFVATAGAQSTAPGRLVVNAVALPAGRSIWPGNSVDSTIVSPRRGGMFYLVTQAADSTAADSVAIEVIPYAGTTKALGGFRLWAPIDLNTSNGAKLDGWFCTTLDSTYLAKSYELTPLSDAGPQFPYRTSSIVVPGQYLMPSGSIALPDGAIAGQFGFGTTDSVDRTRRVFALTVVDGFGAVLDGMSRLSVAVINRHPRVTQTVTVYYVPGE